MLLLFFIESYFMYSNSSITCNWTSLVCNSKDTPLLSASFGGNTSFQSEGLMAKPSINFQVLTFRDAISSELFDLIWPSGKSTGGAK
jgi:hypothetical protein